ncbi:RNA-binding motif protein, X-linked 2-like isoform X1 [Drosophila pseudoobscura]|uniref:RNA-binding motif protein, X-linked 2-like isoform X1 n=1 Tax=Drosophila pseudoobscura pseudoobscura TaxID=46245 RepID=A0A6I8UCQ5_DROPS|nr:RNA-binding motif protein, X-linked 2 isoform X1 [Drosophila pseudoobscura]
MSQPNSVESKQAAPQECRDCSGKQPPATSVEVEDMGTPALEKLIRKANIAQKMLQDVLKQLEKQQVTPESRRDGKHRREHRVSKHRHSAGGKRHKGHDPATLSFSSSNSDGSVSDCELIAVSEERTSRRRHIRDDRKRDRSRSRGRSRGHSRGRSHGRSRSRSYTNPRRPTALPLALPVRISA